MATTPEHLVNYTASPEEPSLDAMRYMLLQRNAMPATPPVDLPSQIPGVQLTPQQMERVVAPPSAVSQIPTGGSPKAPQAQRPLDQVTNDLRAMATGMNPLMMMKSMQDMVTTAVVNPLLMPASIVGEVITGRPVTGSLFAKQPQTPAGQQFAEGLAKTFEAAKVPHMWPLTPRPAGTRPMLTPNDVRVMGAEATRMGRQIRDIPTDYANAAAGLTKLDPVTETPTLGARLGQAERGVVETGKRAERALDPIVTDIMERGGTSADLLAAMAGQPSYAVRPKGTTLITPTRPEPETNRSFTYPHDPVQKVLSEVLGEPQKTTLDPPQIADAYEYSTLAQQMRGIEPALSEYMGQRIAAMYPDAPSQAAAEAAFHARYADTSAKAAKQQELLTDFLTQTPEGLASGVPTPVELQNRHAAAVTWLNGPFANYIKRNVGAEGDPLVKLASQGLTFLSDARIHRMAPDMATRTDVRNDRVAAGFPEMGSFAEAISNKTRELDQLRAEITELESRRAVLFDVARAQGLRNPADLPEYAALTNPIRAKARERDKLQKDIDNLSLGRAYEDLSDFAIAPIDAGDLQQNLSYEMQQFYPTVMQTPGTEMVYRASARRMLDIGLGDIANAFYNDVISGAIPLDKVQKTTVENYVRGKAQDRIKTEAEAKAKEAAYVANVEEKLKAVLADVPNDMKFGNAAVIELTNATPMDTVIARMSEDTEVLDHCVGEGGRAGDKTINLFTGKKQAYTPIIDVLTGQKHSNASRDATAYTRSVGSGSQLASIRSLNTGRPVATLQFEKSHLGQDGQQKYRIGYASGVNNGDIDPAYATAIRDYLNSRADSISGTGENLADNAGVFDTNSQDDIRKLARKLNLSPDHMRHFDWDQSPRFIVADDVRALLQEGQATTRQPATQQPATQQPATQQPMVQGMLETDTLVPATHNAIRDAFGTAVDNVAPNDAEAARLLFNLWQVVQDTYLRDGANIAHLRMARTRLETAEADYAARGTPSNGRVAEAIYNIILPEINHILERRAQPEPQQPMMQGLRETDPLTDNARGDINSAASTAFNMLDGEAASIFNGLWEYMRDLYLTPAATIADLRRLRVRLEDPELLAADRATGAGDVVAEVISEVLLPAINDILERRAQPEPQQPIAQQQILDATAPLAPSARLAIDDAFELVEQAVVGDNEATTRFVSFANDVRNSVLQPNATRADLGLLRERVASAISFYENYNPIQELANAMRNDLLPVIDALIAQPAVQQPFTVEDLRAYLNTAQRTIGVDESRLLRNTLVNARNSFDGAPSWAELLREQPTALAERIAEFAQEQDNAIVEQELLNLADRIAPPPLPEPPARPLNPPDAWPLVGQQLAEQQPAAPAMPDILGAPDVMGIINEVVTNTLNTNGLQIGERVETVVHRIAGQINPVSRTQEYIQALRDAADREQSESVEFILYDIANRIETQMIQANAPDEAAQAANELMAEPEPQQQLNFAPFRPIAAHAVYITYDELRDVLTPGAISEVSATHDGIVRDNPNPNDIRTIARLVFNHQMSSWENFSDTERSMLYMELLRTASRIEAEPTPRRGPFRPAGSAAVRGVPLGNLNLQPAITAEMLRGPDTQPVRNFVQQVRGLPGVTQEGLRTGLMAFEQMDPARQITKTEFVRELLPSSYDIVDLRGASQENQHLMDAAEIAFEEDPEYVGQLLGLKGAQLTAWAKALQDHYNDYDSFPAPIKHALAEQGIEDADKYTEAYDIAYRDALEMYAGEYGGNLVDEEGYTYSETQRLVQPSMGDEYGEFGVTHPDQRGTYRHFDLAPQGVIGHFRGTYNPADPLTLTYWDQQGNQQYFETPNNSYAIEEIQSDAQKIAQQTGHLHQVHGVLFKSAIQKALELGADTVYLPTASIIARTRGSQPKKFAPIYDQAIVKEGLKPLLKIPGVTSKMVNGYHEISFTPEAIEHILTGPGQNVPGYKEGGKVEKAAPGLLSASHRAIERAQEMFPHDKDQDSRADAARHLLASGYLAKSWNPTVAKAAGWWHEFSEAPTRTLRHNLGLGSPRYDYPMDMHNNQLGIELAKKAKTIPEFEKLVQEEILRATEQQTPGRVHVMPAKEAQKAAADSVRQYANGGKVHTTTDLDKMRLELMMRSK